MDDRPRKVWRPHFARNMNRRDSNASVDDEQISDNSEGGHRSRSPRGRRGGGPNRRGGGWRTPGSGRFGDLRDHLNIRASMENLNPPPTSARQLIESLARDKPQEDWQFQGRRGGNNRGSKKSQPDRQNSALSDSTMPQWLGGQGRNNFVAPGPSKESNWRGGQSGPNAPYQRGSPDNGSSSSNIPPNHHQMPQDPDRSYYRRGGRNTSGKRWNNRSLVVSKLENVDDWTTLANLDNTLRIITKLQEFESSWVKSFHAGADFEVLNLAFDIFSGLDLKYRYAKLALMKSLFTNKFIEKIVQTVEKFKTTWFQAGKDKVLSFVGKLRVNLEFVLSNDAAFHDNASSKEAIGLLIEGCVGTLEHINNKLIDLQGGADPTIEKEISDIRELSRIEFIEMMTLDESLHPDDFRERYDVMANNVHGAYQSDDHYIQTHFSLLKEDFQSVLREGVEQYLVDPKKKNFNVWAYENVVVKRFDLFLQERKIDNRKLFFQVTFPECLYFSKINWKYVKRFMFGSLVVLTSDKFKTYSLALIEERVLDNPDAISIVISFIYSPPKGVEDAKFLLVEPKVFYEPYLNSMKVLKHMAKIGLPMKKYIVQADTCPAVPAYLNPESVYKIGPHNIKVNNIVSWPKAEDLGLNRAQKEAFVNALTSEMALIQGPPGTGKTFLAFKIIETLLNNRKNSFIDGPIMIVCYKNHSLDQILEGLLKANKRGVVRIGGQSKIKALKWECNVRNLPAPPTISSLISEKYNLQQKLRSTLADIKKTVSLVSLIKARIGILNMELLKQLQIVAPDIEWPETYRVDEWLLELFDEAPQITVESIQQQWNEIKRNPDIQGLLDEETLSAVYQSNLISIGNEVSKLGNLLSQLESVNANVEQQEFWEINEHYWFAYNKYISLLQGLNFTVDPSDCPDVTGQGFAHLELEERWALCRKWESDLVKHLEARIVDLQNQVPEIEENLSEYEEMVMSQTLKYERPQVIGVTTSGASKHYSALADVGAKIVLVEEAAEVLEAHVIASLSTKCQHLILIGDHQQLKPNTASHDIGARYRMNVSLFERMIINDIKLSCLSTQHRMRPEISALVCPAIYKNLENHPSVHTYPNVIGTKKNVFFFNHEHLEQVGYDSESKYNPGEGDMLIAIAYYLLRQGYKPDQITILSTYLEQDRYIKKAIDKQYGGSELKEVFCTVVDNFQGEENIIILLSLVRSNQNGDVGFLSTKNRVCVALSRAKHGLFIFGNMKCLSKKEPTIWSEINEVLIDQESISCRFPLRCVRHGNITEVASRQEIDALKHAGCRNPCDAPLSCGHTCKIMCHGHDQEHVEAFKCREKCMRQCENGHTCQAPCRELCPPCPFMMPKLLVCHHSRQLECHKANLQAFCTEILEIKLERCGHNQLVLCKLTEQSERHRIVCRSDCKHTFNCGHVCKRTCHVSEDPDHKTKFLCEEPCELINKSCPRKHRCNKKCREPCGDCMVIVEKSLPCGHKAEMKCCRDVDGFECHQDCERKLPCGHDCKNLCCATCGPCKMKVEKVIEECGHNILFKCSDTATRSHCRQACETIKSCGHPCTGMCKEICEDLVCKSQVKVELPCGHEASVACGVVKRQLHTFTTECKKPCEAKLPCGHRCKGTCGLCLEGRVHIPCYETCNKPLLCSHQCQVLCSESLHSCANSKCFNTCWQNELKNRPSGYRQSHGKKRSNVFNPKSQMVFEIRSELGRLNSEMSGVARSYDGNKSVVQNVKKIQIFVNKSRTITKYDEELPILKTCLFKVEFISVVFKIIRRLETMQLPDAKHFELERFLEKLVVRSASNHVMGSYEMTQMREQVIWVSLFLDIQNMVNSHGQRNDVDYTDSMFFALNGNKTCFGPNERTVIWNMLNDYNERMAVKLPLTDVDFEGLFSSSDKFCKPICHHRVDVVLEQNEQESAKAVGGSNSGKSTTGGTRSLVSDEYDDEVVLPKKAKKKRAKVDSNDTAEKMDVEEGSLAPEAVSVFKSSDENVQASSTVLPAELNCPENTTLDYVVQTSDCNIEKENMHHIAAAVPNRSPSSEASHLLSQMMLDRFNDASQESSIQVQVHQTVPVQSAATIGQSLKNPNGSQSGGLLSDSSETFARDSPPYHQVQIEAGDFVPSTQPSQIQVQHGEFKQQAELGHFAVPAAQVVPTARTSNSDTEPTVVPNRMNPFTAQREQNLSRPNEFAMRATAGPTANRLAATTTSPSRYDIDDPAVWNIIQPDAEARIDLDGID